MFFKSAITLVIIASAAIAANAQLIDPRQIANGNSIYENGYIDQPYVLVLKDKRWLCVFTTSGGKEGSSGQHIVSSTSADEGKTWSVPVAIEPATGPAASWAVPYLTSFGRIYVFYDYNGDNITTLNGQIIRNDMLGWYCYKYSDDNGKSWSQRLRLPVRKTPVDINNDWKGEVQIMWGISKPILSKGKVFFAFTKLGKYLLDKGEGWFFVSDNLNTEKDASRLHWQMLPEGEQGLRNPAFGSVQEEHNIVALHNGDLYCMYRTTIGFPAHAYSRDAGKTWTMPEPASYTPGGQQLFRHPRACPKIFKCANGKFLFWFHNHAGRGYEDRNPVWIAGGIEKDGFINWSQPEILLYGDDTSYQTGRMSYPDLVEQDAKYWITETQKVKARVHAIDPLLLQGLWNQRIARSITQKGLVINRAGIKPRETIKSPALTAVKNSGFSIELWLYLHDLLPGQTVMDNRDVGGKGIYIKTTDVNTLKIAVSDGKKSFEWDTDPGVLVAGKQQHIVFIVDRASGILSVCVDGRLCDGGGARQFGWARVPKELGDINSENDIILAPDMHGQLKRLRIYNRYLRTSEAISNFNAGNK